MRMESESMQILNVNYTDTNAQANFCQSLRETGFAVLNNHPISPILINEVYLQWQYFFQSNFKNDYLFDREKQDGYFPFKSENAKGYKKSDLKEFYHIYPWGRIPPPNQQSSLLLYTELLKLAEVLLKWVQQGLPQDVVDRLSIPLSEMIINSSQTLLRVLHYPAIESNDDEDAVRAAPHEDINLITLLPAATAPGLEVKDNAGRWHAIDCNPGNIIVNVGDMLQMCTDYYYKSTTHRVVNPKSSSENKSRFSMPLFLHARSEVKLSQHYTAREYLHERLKEIGVM